MIGERLMERFALRVGSRSGGEAEPPLPLAVEEVAVEVAHERSCRLGSRRSEEGE